LTAGTSFEGATPGRAGQRAAGLEERQGVTRRRIM
jgi:hypothetical protein